MLFCMQKTSYVLRISDGRSDVCSSDLRDPGAQSVDQFLSIEPLRRLVGSRGVCARGGIDQVGIGDQFGQYHRNGLQRLDLDIVIAARIAVLDTEHADGALAADDRNPRETVEQFLARLDRKSTRLNSSH